VCLAGALLPGALLALLALLPGCLALLPPRCLVVSPCCLLAAHAPAQRYKHTLLVDLSGVSMSMLAGKKRHVLQRIFGAASPLPPGPGGVWGGGGGGGVRGGGAGGWGGCKAG